MGSTPFRPPVPFRGRNSKPRTRKVVPKALDKYMTVDSNFNRYYTVDPLRGAADINNAGLDSPGTLPSYAALSAQQDLADNYLRAQQAGVTGATGPGGYVSRGPGGSGAPLLASDTVTPYAGGSTGGGGGGALPTSPDAGEAYTGFASRYVPGERDLLFGPGGGRTILHDFLAQGGNDLPNLEGDFGRYADNAFRFYQLLMGGNTADPEMQADDTIINWVADFLAEQSKVGGKSPTVQALLEGLFEGFSNKDSTLGATMYDTEGNPVGTEEQINAVMSAIPLLGEFSNDAYAASLYKSAARRAVEYRSLVAKGQADGTFLDYLESTEFAGR